MGRIFLDIATPGGGPKLARLRSPSLTWPEIDDLLASVKNGSYQAPAQPVAPVAPAPSTVPHVGIEPDIAALEKYRA